MQRSQQQARAWYKESINTRSSSPISPRYSNEPKTALASARIPADHTDAARKLGRCDVAPLTFEPVRFEGEELPQSSMLRKYALTSDGGAQEESLPPKNVEKYRPPMERLDALRYCNAC